MNDGRKIIDADPAAARQDRAHARALGAGRGLCRSNRRLPLYGVSPADTGAVPTSAGQVGCMATDGSRLPTVSTTVRLGTDATNSNTNKPNEDQRVPVSAPGGILTECQSYHRRDDLIPVAARIVLVATALSSQACRIRSSSLILCRASLGRSQTLDCRQPARVREHAHCQRSEQCGDCRRRRIVIRCGPALQRNREICRHRSFPSR